MNAAEIGLQQAARRLVRESRAAQGLPARLRDHVVIRRVAALLQESRNGPLGEPNALSRRSATS
jgi:hypothetical protein